MPIFDRFVRYSWAERALESTINKNPPKSIRDWLIAQGLGNESARRTSNILSRMWIKPSSANEPLRNDALALFPAVDISEHLVLHWGMAIVQFPIFQETAKIIGRLGLLQGEFTKEEIINRVLTKYSNQSTISRAIERTIQTMADWSVIQITPQRNFQLKPTRSIPSPALAEWLFRAIMIETPEKYWLLHDLLGALEIFPFDMKSLNTILYKSPYLTIVRDASGAETIGLRDR